MGMFLQGLVVAGGGLFIFAIFKVTTLANVLQ